MKYSDVLNLITPENVKKWCGLAECKIKIITNHENKDIICHIYSSKKSYCLFRLDWNDKILRDTFEDDKVLYYFQSLIFEAWAGWNRKVFDDFSKWRITLCIDCVYLWNEEHYDIDTGQINLFYSDFESGHPLLEPVQALMCALVKADELEAQNAKNYQKQ